MTDTLHFRGHITVVTPDGRSAIVTLDDRVEGNTYAVISPNTAGRVDLLNGRGTLSTGTKVEGEATVGPSALKAISVTERT